MATRASPFVGICAPRVDWSSGGVAAVSAATSTDILHFPGEFSSVRWQAATDNPALQHGFPRPAHQLGLVLQTEEVDLAPGSVRLFLGR